jgi:hypothetical protein
MKKTLKAFTAQSSIDAKLIRATVRQFGDWEYFKQSAPDVSNYGAAGGFSGFTYYTDTCAFYAGNRALIVALVADMADNLGEDQITMVRGFNCLGKDYTPEEIGQTLYGPKNKHQIQVANALAWFALEEVARSFVDFVEG